MMSLTVIGSHAIDVLVVISLQLMHIITLLVC